MSTKEEVLERGRELYTDIFESPFLTEVLNVLETSQIDDILFALFHDSVTQGYLLDITDRICQEHTPDDSPIYAVTGMKLRTLMCASLTIGMWHQKLTDGLETMWAVDKNSE